MRKKNQKQMPLMDCGVEHPRAKALERISQILDSLPIITEMVLRDLTQGVKNHNTGAKGMSAEQVLRAATIKQTEGFSYEGLAFHLVDSRTYRNFCRIGIMQKGFKKSALCSNIKAISPETWENIQHVLIAYAEDKKVERGRQSRIDCTVVESNIHEPSDSTLLWDCVRVLTRKLMQIRERFDEVKVPFTDHRRRAKRRMLGIMHAKAKKVRKQRYVDLVKVTDKTLGYAQTAVAELTSASFSDPMKMIAAQGIAEYLKQIIPLAQGVIDQTRRRVLNDEQVPSSEKIVSIFEPHTD